MLNKLSARIEQIATGRLLLLLMLFILLGVAVVSSFSPSAELKALANGLDIPDAQLWRSADGFYQQLEAYGEHGRFLYLTRISPVDIFIPLTQALLLSVAITLVYRHAFALDSRWQLLNTIPFVTLVADYLENGSMIALMLAYPTRLDALAIAASLFTAVKIIVSMVSLLLILIGIIVLIWKRSVRRLPNNK